MGDGFSIHRRTTNKDFNRMSREDLANWIETCRLWYRSADGEHKLRDRAIFVKQGLNLQAIYEKRFGAKLP